MRASAVVVALALAAAAGGSAAQKAKPQANNRERAELMKSLRALLLYRLKDPESARFREEFLSSPEDANSSVKSLCGQVNAKNSHGGYTGFAPFIVNTDGMLVMDTHDVPSATQYLWPVWCARPL